jgi:S1-C subfamily serine protease
MWISVLSGLDKGHAAEVGDDAVTIGSGAGCTIVLTDPDVAPLHASVRCNENGDCEIVRLDDSRPVRVDGEEVTDPRPIKPGQRITIGDVELEALDRAPADPSPAIDPDLAAALGSDGPNADDEITPTRERRRSKRALALAAGALALAAVAGILAITGIIGGDDGPDVEKLVADATPRTVRITASEGAEEASGSGWVLDAKAGLVVTNFHVVNGASDYEVVVSDDPRPADLIGAAPCDDLAVLKVGDTEGLETMTIAPGKSIAQGEPVVAVGFAAGAGDRLTSTAGVVSVPSQPLDAPTPDAPNFPDVVQTDAAINPGNSGGPLLDEDGRLVGVNTAVLLERGGVPLQNIGYALGADRVREVTSELRRKRSMSWLGTGLQFLPPKELRKRGLPPGVVTVSAAPDTPAHDAGLKGKSVVLTEINGKGLDGTMPQYCAVTQGKRTGDKARLGVVTKRGGKTRQLPLAFG